MIVLRAGLVLVFAASVLAFGGVEVWGQSGIEISAAVLLLIWALLVWRKPEAKIYWSPLNCPLLGLIVIGLLQLLLHGTAYPFLTRAAVLRLAAYFLIFFLTAQAFRTRGELSKLVWFIIIFCFGVSLFAIAQHFTSDREIYWMSAFKMDVDPFGPYVNRNHFAGFIELTLPMGIAMMAFRGIRRHLYPLTGLMTLIPVSALILSGSRSGIIGFAFEIGVLAMLVRSKSASFWKSPRMVGAAILVLAAFALIWWVGAGGAIQRFSALSVHDVSRGRRTSMFRGAAHIFVDHPIKGCGLGTLTAVYPLYETAYDGLVVDHAHNDYIETLAETGLLGGLCGIAFLWILYREAQKNFTAEQGHFSRALHAGAIAALSGLLLHSFVDFNLQIPANAMLFLLQAYLATSLPLASSLQEPRRRAHSNNH
jgi:O-antigen ligase